MFESTATPAADLDGLLTALLDVEEGWQPNVARIDLLDALERATAAMGAVQARVTAAFVAEEEQVAAEWRARAAADDDDFAAWRAARDEARRHELTDRAGSGHTEDWPAGRRPEDRVGVAAQVALALRVSPTRGSAFVRFAAAVVHDLPHVLIAMETGELSKRRAELVVQETAVLDAEQRRAVDAELEEELAGVWGQLGDRELVRRVRAAVCRADAEAVVERCRIAESRRRVTIRPLPTRCVT